jgi:hypothetical protein
MRSMLADVGTMKFGPELIKGVVKNYKEVPGKVQSTINKAKRLSFKNKRRNGKKGAKKGKRSKKRSALSGSIDGKFTVTKRIISDNAPQVTAATPKKTKKS